MSKTSGPTAGKKKKSGDDNIIRVIIEAVVMVLVIRTFLFQPFYIPSASMRPTLLEGDYIFVSKYAYGYSHYSLPFWPNLFSGRVWSSPPERGDVVVFHPPGGAEDYYIKRVIGLPGDTVQVSDGALYLNGQPVKREKVGESINPEIVKDSYIGAAIVYRETLPNGVSYDTLDINLHGQYDNTPLYTVAPGHYFMMGDNRDDSQDSRTAELGQVPDENLIGRANLRFFSISNGASAWQLWRWPFDVRWGRIFTFVQTIQNVPAD